jgi:hypothetical protein
VTLAASIPTVRIETLCNTGDIMSYKDKACTKESVSIFVALPAAFFAAGALAARLNT